MWLAEINSDALIWSTWKTAGYHKSLTQNWCHKKWNTHQVQHTEIVAKPNTKLALSKNKMYSTAPCLSWELVVFLLINLTKNNKKIVARKMWIQFCTIRIFYELWALMINHRTVSFFSSCLHVFSLATVSCTEPAVYLRPSGLSSLPPQSLPEHFDHVPTCHLPSILPEAHHYHVPLGHGVMQRHKPLTGVLLLEWIHEDSLEAQWSSGPLGRSQARDASGPSVSYNQHLSSRSSTHTKKCTSRQTHKFEITHLSHCE